MGLYSPVTTVATGSFRTSTDGFVSGTLLDDPVDRQRIEGALIDSTESGIIWGGIPVKLTTSAPGAASTLGPKAKRATSHAEIMGWAVYNQANAGIITGASNAAQYTAGFSINFVRAGSLVRMVLPVDPTLVASLTDASELTQVSWDFSANQIVAYDSTNVLPVVIEFLSTTSLRPVLTSTTLNWSSDGAVAVVRIGR